MDRQELIRRLGRAKVLIDGGMCRVGSRIDRRKEADGLFLRLTGRALGLSDAVVALCRQEHPYEALPLLRQLAETSARMSYLALPEQGGLPSRDARASALAAELSSSSWEGLWPEGRFLGRSGGLDGVPELLSSCADFVEGGPTILPWGHAFQSPRPARSPEAVLAAALGLMKAALKALDARWPGDFPGTEHL